MVSFSKANLSTTTEYSLQLPLFSCIFHIRSSTSHPKLVYSTKTCSWPLCFVVFLLHSSTNFLVSFSSDPSPGIFFVCKRAGRSKDPRRENWNCQLLACFLHPQMKIQIVFWKLLQYCRWSCFSLSNKRLYFWLWIARHC